MILSSSCCWCPPPLLRSRSLLTGDFAAGYASGDMARHGVGTDARGSMQIGALSTFAKAAAFVGGEFARALCQVIFLLSISFLFF